MNGISKFLWSQRDELSAKLPSLEARRDEYRSAWIKASNDIAAIQEDLRKIDLALKTIESEDAKSAHPTIMQAVIEVLKSKPEGMTALEILAEINERYFDGKILRTSLSPQLSRLKDRDRKITLRGNRWNLVGEEEPTLFTSKS
jgi:hypothetical protein